LKAGAVSQKYFEKSLTKTTFLAQALIAVQKIHFFAVLKLAPKINFWGHLSKAIPQISFERWD
jgi:hypothetical protein